MYPRQVNEATQFVASSSSSSAMLACATDTFTSLTLGLNSQESANSACWPLTDVVYLAVRGSYTTIASDGSSCDRGIKALQFVQWLITTPLLDAATRSQSSPRPADLSNIGSAIIDALNNVTCDGTTMLVTLPVVWSLSSGVGGFGLSMSIIGLLGIVALLTIVAVYRNHPVMRSASWWFILTSLSGVGLMLIGLVFWVSKATTANCNGFSWCTNLGFMLTFGPLFAKTWRIYRIFGGKKLNVIKISNRKLSTMVVFLISVEILILAIWQAVGPLQPMTTIQTTGSPVSQHQYTQCGTTSDGSRFLIVIGVTKGALLLYGALLAFSTRRVTDHFNESQSIAWAIYNVVFSVGITIPIIVFVGAIGDVIVLLVLFLILWISYFTALIIIVPKLMALFAPLTQLNSAELSGAKSSIGGFSFLSIAEMTQPILLMQYQSALKEQLKLVTQKLEQVKNGTKIASTPIHDSRVQSLNSPEHKILRPQPTSSISSSSAVTAFSPISRSVRPKALSEVEKFKAENQGSSIPSSGITLLPGEVEKISEKSSQPDK